MTMGYSEKALKAKKAYMREWNKRNKERRAQYENKYWENVADLMAKAESEEVFFAQFEKKAQ